MSSFGNAAATSTASKHQASDYLLTGLLHAKQDGEPLVGVLCGRVGKKVRYYRHRRGYVKDSVFNRFIPAKALEDAVVDVVARMLTEEGDSLRDRIVTLVKQESQKTVSSDGLVAIKERRDKVKKRTALIVATLDEESLADARDELDRLKVERRALDAQIAAAEAATAMKSVDPTEVADAIVVQLRAMATNVSGMPKFALRQLMTSVIGSVTVDIESRAVEIALVLPLGKIFSGGLVDGKAMRPVGRSAWSSCPIAPAY
jgi:hypothetical protein